MWGQSTPTGATLGEVRSWRNGVGMNVDKSRITEGLERLGDGNFSRTFQLVYHEGQDNRRGLSGEGCLTHMHTHSVCSVCAPAPPTGPEPAAAALCTDLCSGSWKSGTIIGAWSGGVVRPWPQIKP